MRPRGPGRSIGIALRPRAPPSPTLPRKLRGGGRTGVAISEWARGLARPAAPPPGSHYSPTSPQNCWGRLGGPTDLGATTSIGLASAAAPPRPSPATCAGEGERHRSQQRAIEFSPLREERAGRGRGRGPRRTPAGTRSPHLHPGGAVSPRTHRCPSSAPRPTLRACQTSADPSSLSPRSSPLRRRARPRRRAPHPRLPYRPGPRR